MGILNIFKKRISIALLSAAIGLAAGVKYSNDIRILLKELTQETKPAKSRKLTEEEEHRISSTAEKIVKKLIEELKEEIRRGEYKEAEKTIMAIREMVKGASLPHHYIREAERIQRVEIKKKISKYYKAFEAALSEGKDEDAKAYLKMAHELSKRFGITKWAGLLKDAINELEKKEKEADKTRKEMRVTEVTIASRIRASLRLHLSQCYRRQKAEQFIYKKDGKEQVILTTEEIERILKKFRKGKNSVSNRLREESFITAVEAYLGEKIRKDGQLKKLLGR